MLTAPCEVLSWHLRVQVPPLPENPGSGAQGSSWAGDLRSLSAARGCCRRSAKDSAMRRRLLLFSVMTPHYEEAVPGAS